MTAIDSIDNPRLPFLLAVLLLCCGIVLGVSAGRFVAAPAASGWLAVSGGALLLSILTLGQLWRVKVRLVRRATRGASALRRSEASLRTLADTVPVGIIDIDERDRVAYGNAAWHQLVAGDHTPAVAWLPNLHPDDVDELLEAWRGARSTGRTLSRRIRVCTADGGVRWVDATVVPLLDRLGRLRRAIGCVVDTTRVVDTESQLSRSRDDAVTASNTKSEFLARVGHELRTPLNGVIGTAELLLSGELAREQRRRAQVLLNSGQYLLQLLDELLDFSKLEAGMVAIESIPFDVAALVREVGELYEGPARRRGLGFSVAVDERVPAMVAGDPTRLRQVLINLLNNAVKFTERGSVAVAVEPVDGPTGPELRLSVRDTGIGIAPSEHERVFGAFVQAESSTTRRFGGTGLGLAICAQLVAITGGRIGLDSAEGQGSTFWFTAPLRPVAVATAADAADSPASVAPAPPDRAGDPRDVPAVDRERPAPRVLLVEDDEVNQLVAAGLLESLGYVVDVAYEGKQALDAITADDDYDVVLMDCQMPVMDGFAASRALRARGGRAGDLPIIAMTAATAPEDRRRCAEAGMDDFVAKPVTRQDLEQTLADQLARRTELALQ